MPTPERQVKSKTSNNKSAASTIGSSPPLPRLLFVYHKSFLYNRAKLAWIVCTFIFCYNLSFWLFGDGYSIRGGLAGELVDAFLQRQQLSAVTTTHIRVDESIVYPMVTERSRRRKVPVYSRFLKEVLMRHQHDRNGSDILQQQSVFTDSDQPILQTIVTSIDSITSLQKESIHSQSMRSILAQAQCRPGWLCHRCLSSSRWGSLRACRQVCPVCYAQMVSCGTQSILTDRSPHTEPSKYRLQFHQETIPASHRIPRIIHQEFQEWIFPWQYPELDRMQNAWRANTNWEYRFYTPVLARSFVQRSFPALILHAYDSLVPEQQTSFFRLLVLFKEGGIYANVDLSLETDLETLVDDSIGFMAARADSIDGIDDHCLWNGLIAAQPGHPFLVRAIEGIVAAVMAQQTEENIEASICLHDDSPIWKIRRSTVAKNVLGSCALGMAVHGVLQQEALKVFQLGRPSPWTNTSHGQFVILMVCY